MEAERSHPEKDTSPVRRKTGRSPPFRRFRRYNPSVNSRPGLWWTVAATATVLSAALWLRSPATASLVACGVSTLVTLVLTVLGERAWNRIGFAVSAAAFVALVALAERSRASFAAESPAGRSGRRGSRHRRDHGGAAGRDGRAAAAGGAGARRARGSPPGVRRPGQASREVRFAVGRADSRRRSGRVVRPADGAARLAGGTGRGVAHAVLSLAVRDRGARNGSRRGGTARACRSPGGRHCRGVRRAVRSRLRRARICLRIAGERRPGQPLGRSRGRGAGDGRAGDRPDRRAAGGRRARARTHARRHRPRDRGDLPALGDVARSRRRRPPAPDARGGAGHRRPRAALTILECVLAVRSDVFLRGERRPVHGQRRRARPDLFARAARPARRAARAGRHAVARAGDSRRGGGRGRRPVPAPRPRARHPIPRGGGVDRDVARVGGDALPRVGVGADRGCHRRPGRARRAKGDPALDRSRHRGGGVAPRARPHRRARRVSGVVPGALGRGDRFARVRAPRARVGASGGDRRGVRRRDARVGTVGALARAARGTRRG